MDAKKTLLKPLLLQGIDRLKRFIELDAPAVIIGAEAWQVFATVLAAYGSVAGSTMIESIRDRNLHGRGVCNHEDCGGYVERPGIGICAAHLKALGLDEITGDDGGESDPIAVEVAMSRK